MTLVKILEQRALYTRIINGVKYIAYKDIKTETDDICPIATFNNTHHITEIFSNYVCKKSSNTLIRRFKNRYYQGSPARGLIGEAANTLVANSIGFNSHQLQLISIDNYSFNVKVYFERIVGKSSLQDILNNCAATDRVKIVKTVLSKIFEISCLNFYHGDMNSSNILCNNDSRGNIDSIQIIDFELASPASCSTQLCFSHMCVSVYDWRINELISPAEMKAIIYETISSKEMISSKASEVIETLITPERLDKQQRQHRLKTINPLAKKLTNYL
jgi:tRNA A-37 threonylcarbamoyl transferase component Bud32